MITIIYLSPCCLLPLHAVVRITAELIHFCEQLPATTGSHITATATSLAYRRFLLPRMNFTQSHGFTGVVGSTPTENDGG